MNNPPYQIPASPIGQHLISALSESHSSFHTPVPELSCKDRVRSYKPRKNIDYFVVCAHALLVCVTQHLKSCQSKGGA